MLGSGPSFQDVSDGDQAFGDDADAAELELYRCFVCEKQEYLSDLPQCKGGHYMHQDCWLANRAYLRDIAHDQPRIAKHTHNMKHNPGAWRAKVMPYKVSTHHGASRDQARQATRAELLEETLTQDVNAEEALGDTLLLTAMQFEAHVGFWEKCSQPEAGRRFQALLVEQGDKHAKHGEDRVAYAGIDKLRSRQGTETRHGVRKQSELSETNYEIKRRRISAKSPGRFPPNISSPPSSSGRPSGPAPQSPHSARSADTLIAMPKPVSSEKKKQHGQFQKQQQDELRQRIPSLLNNQDLMRRRELMEADCDSAMLKLVGPKGTIPKLEKFRADMTTEQKANEVHEHTGVLQASLLEIKAKVHGFKQRADGCAATSMLDLEAEIAAAAHRVDAMVEKVSSHMDALKYCNDRHLRQKRKKYLSDRHQIVKYRASLTSTTWPFPKKLAETLGKRIYEMQVFGEDPTDKVRCHPVSEFQVDQVSDYSEIMLLPKGSQTPEAKGLAEALQGLAVDNRLKHTIEIGDIALVKDKQLRGCTQVLPPISLQGIGGMSGLAEGPHTLLGDKGGPYLCSSRPWVYRMGPSAVPLSGCAVWLIPQTGTWLLTCIPVTSLSAGGIVVGDFDSFAKSDAGGSFVAENCKSFRVDKGDMAFVPFGYLAMMTLMVEAAPKHKVETACFIAWNVLSTKHAAMLDKHVWDGLTTACSKYYVGKTHQSWKHMDSALGDFNEAVKAAAAPV